MEFAAREFPAYKRPRTLTLVTAPLHGETGKVRKEVVDSIVSAIST